MSCDRICTGQFFGTWEAETESLPLIANNYYLMPIRLPRNLIVQTNNAVSPLLRCTQQSFKSNHLAQHAEPPSWRFETLSKIIPFANTIHETINVPNYIYLHLKIHFIHQIQSTLLEQTVTKRHL